MTEEMKPCPFCNANQAAVRKTTNLESYWGACFNCSAEGPHDNTRMGAIVAWNTRADTEAATLRAKLAEVERFAQECVDLGTVQAADADRVWEALGVLGEEYTVDDALARIAALTEARAAWNASCQDGHPLVMFKADTIDACPVCQARADLARLQADFDAVFTKADQLGIERDQARAEAESLRASGRRRPFITKTADGDWAFEWEHKGVDVLGVFTPGEDWTLVLGDEEHEAITTDRLAEILDFFTQQTKDTGQS